MMDNNPEECSVCFNDYDDNQLRPRTLPCYHTFCSQCIDNAIKNGQLTCPRCHARHAAKAATQFLISYSMEALVRKLKDIQRTQEKTEPAKKKLRSLVQEQKIIISSLTTNCKEVQETIREAMEMMTTETGATADPVPLEDSASSIMNKDQDITGEILNKQLTVRFLFFLICHITRY
nr:E3 ubiquitin-protein ligase TRIM21-like [Procambarus clarkii]